MKYGFLHTAAVSPALHVADCAYNTQQIIAAMRAQAVAGTKLLCLPEFTLTGYTCSDLFLQETLCRGAEDGLIQILDASKELDVVALVGLPVRHNGKLYNCAAVVCKGQLLGLVPKTYLPNYGEFYERRHFVPGPKDAFEITFAGQRTLFGTNSQAGGTGQPARTQQGQQRLPAARCRSLCLGWKSVRTFGPLCPPAVAMRWPGQRWLQTFLPAMKR